MVLFLEFLYKFDHKPFLIKSKRNVLKLVHKCLTYIGDLCIFKLKLIISLDRYLIDFGDYGACRFAFMYYKAACNFNPSVGRLSVLFKCKMIFLYC